MKAASQPCCGAKRWMHVPECHATVVCYLQTIHAMHALHTTHSFHLETAELYFSFFPRIERALSYSMHITKDQCQVSKGNSVSEFSVSGQTSVTNGITGTGWSGYKMKPGVRLFQSAFLLRMK